MSAYHRLFNFRPHETEKWDVEQSNRQEHAIGGQGSVRRTVKRDLARRLPTRRSGFTGRINGTRATFGAYIWRLSNFGLFPSCGPL